MTRTTKPKHSNVTSMGKRQIEIADILREHIREYQRKYPLQKWILI